MPNHINTEVEITGTKEQIADLIKKTGITLDPDLETNKFDFNGIVKMPKELLDTVSPPEIVATQEEADKINSEHAKRAKNNKWFSEPIRAITEDERKRREKEHGAITWYEFANRFWGTKWNAYEVRYFEHTDTKLVIGFQTAWDTPRGIWETLEKQGYHVRGVIYGEMDGYDFINDGSEVFDAYQDVTVEYVG